MATYDTLERSIETCVVHPDELSACDRHSMWELFSSYYENVERQLFEADLAGKDRAFLLKAADEIVGFSTASVSDFPIGDQSARVVFSGDTIVDKPYWGELQLAKAWLAEMGRMSREEPASKFYWFLIVKGHRTYRYLPAFAHKYVPQTGSAEVDFELLALRDALAKDRFGDCFDTGTGVIRFSRSRGNLMPDWAEPSAREMNLQEVQFFLHANPGFREGDELACLCSLAPENMKPLARRWYDAGRNAA